MCLFVRVTAGEEKPPERASTKSIAPGPRGVGRSHAHCEGKKQPCRNRGVQRGELHGPAFLLYRTSVRIKEQTHPAEQISSVTHERFWSGSLSPPSLASSPSAGAGSEALCLHAPQPEGTAAVSAGISCSAEMVWVTARSSP